MEEKALIEINWCNPLKQIKKETSKTTADVDVRH